jgi:hypothetical protein
VTVSQKATKTSEKHLAIKTRYSEEQKNKPAPTHGSSLHPPLGKMCYVAAS